MDLTRLSGCTMNSCGKNHQVLVSRKDFEIQTISQKWDRVVRVGK